MVEATATLAQAYSKPERTRREGNITYIQTQFATRVRSAIISLAKREAREAIKRKLRAEGKVRVTLLSASEINSLLTHTCGRTQQRCSQRRRPAASCRASGPLRVSGKIPETEH
jgi:hypothetical protein